MKRNLSLKSSILLMFFLCGIFGLNAQSSIFSEDFSGFTDSTSTDLSSTLDNYTSVSGWSGSKVYQSNGKVKLGTSSALGWLQTPAIDLSANGGNFTLEFDAVAWYHDSTTILVYLDNTSYEVSGLGNDGNYGTYGHFSVSLTGGTSNSHIKFEGKQSGKARFFLDNVTITQSGEVPTISAPTVSISGNAQSADTYFGSVSVTLSAANGASIYYTLDGTEPTSASTLYTAPFTITETSTLKAIAISGDNSSSVVTRTITILNMTPIFFEDFESDGLNQMTVTNVSGTYEWTTGTHSGNTYAYANAYNQGATETWLITPAITPLNAGGVSLSFTNAKNYNGPDISVKYSTNYNGSGSPATATWTDITSECALSSGSWNWVESGNVEVAGTSPVYFAWVYTSGESSAAGWEIDNILVLAEAGGASEVATPVINPNGGSYYEPQTVSITCADADAVIRYTTDGTEPTESSTVYSQPFIVSTTTTIMAKAWKTNMTPSFTATATISFPTQVANIAAFKAAASNEPQQIMSDVTFVFRSGRYVFVEDNTAAMLIFDNSSPVITSTYNEGDVIQAGVFGKYTTYQGMVEMVPTHNSLEASGTPVTVTPANATISNIKSQYTDVYESKLVRLSNVTFISGTQFVQNGDTMAIYNRFNTVTTEISAGDLADVTGFVSYSTNHGYQIYPRGDEDIDIHTVVIMDTVATPEFDLFKDGEFYRVNITCATEGASIYYTLDGTDPDESANLFTGLFPLTLNVHYTLKAIAMKEGMVNSAIAVYDYNPSGINNFELRNNLSIYPNPAINNVTINVKNDNVTIEKVELYNIYGQLLNMMYVNENTAEVSVHALATGTYFAKIFTDKGIVTMPVIRK